jgi:hypothetical protein
MLNLILIVKMLQSIKPFFNFTNRTFLKEKWRNDSLRIWVFVVRIIVLGSVGVFCSNATTNLAIAPRRLRESFLLHIVMNTYLPTHIFLEKSPPHLTLETSNLLSLFSLRFLRWWSCWLFLSYKHHPPPQCSPSTVKPVCSGSLVFAHPFSSARLLISGDDLSGSLVSVLNFFICICVDSDNGYIRLRSFCLSSIFWRVFDVFKLCVNV